MAMNIGQMRNALTGSSIPAGWNYDALNACYRGPNGEIITEMDILQHGSFVDALREYKIQQSYELAKQSMITNAPPPSGWLGQGISTTDERMRIVSDGSLSVSSVKPLSNLTITGKLGQITINLDTGELTMPPNVGRDAAIRDFWLGFQEHFQPTNKAEYERTIADLRHDIQALKDKAIAAEISALKSSTKKVAKKIMDKYSGEKFIMIKPDDLIKFIEGE